MTYNYKNSTPTTFFGNDTHLEISLFYINSFYIMYIQLSHVRILFKICSLSFIILYLFSCNILFTKIVMKRSPDEKHVDMKKTIF